MYKICGHLEGDWILNKTFRYTKIELLIWMQVFVILFRFEFDSDNMFIIIYLLQLKVIC